MQTGTIPDDSRCIIPLRIQNRANASMEFPYKRVVKKHQGVFASLPSRSGGSRATNQSPDYPRKKEIASLPELALSAAKRPLAMTFLAFLIIRLTIHYARAGYYVR
jgi:hypothetical protein